MGHAEAPENHVWRDARIRRSRCSDLLLRYTCSHRSAAIGGPTMFGCLILSRGLSAQPAASEVQTCGRISIGISRARSPGAFRKFRLASFAGAPIGTTSPSDTQPSSRNMPRSWEEADGSGALPGRPGPFLRLCDAYQCSHPIFYL
jgi:hypothetical protein